MRVSQVKALMYQITKMYFADATVVFARQSRTAKGKLPLVSITPGNVKRNQYANYRALSGINIGSYQSRIGMTIDLFTNGAPIVDDETGAVVAYENTAMDDMLSFADFLDSQFALEWCNQNDVTILVDGDVQDLTGLVNDNNYEYRARMNLLFYFTQNAIGNAAVLDESGINHSGNEVSKDEATGYVTSFRPSPSGGGTKELADKKTGYFTEVEIKEDTGNE